MYCICLQVGVANLGEGARERVGVCDLDGLLAPGVTAARHGNHEPDECRQPIAGRMDRSLPM
jgi:hypothetical protein